MGIFPGVAVASLESQEQGDTTCRWLKSQGGIFLILLFLVAR